MKRNNATIRSISRRFNRGNRPVENSVARQNRQKWPLALVAFMMAGFGCEDAPPRPPAAPVVESRRIERRPAGSPISSAESLESAEALLARLKAERLAVVDEVALWKWIHEKPIEDPERESKVLDGVETIAEERGLDRVDARRFFESLMADARKRQHDLHDQWRKNRPPADAKEPDLVSLRQRIDQLTPRLLDAWGRSAKTP